MTQPQYKQPQQQRPQGQTMSAQITPSQGQPQGGASWSNGAGTFTQGNQPQNPYSNTSPQMLAAGAMNYGGSQPPKPGSNFFDIGFGSNPYGGPKPQPAAKPIGGDFYNPTYGRPPQGVVGSPPTMPNPYGGSQPPKPPQGGGQTPQWNLKPFNPQQSQNSYANPPKYTPPMPSTYAPPNPAGQGGVLQGFFGGGGQNFFNPESFVADDSPYGKYIQNMLPVAQFGQNAYQWGSELDSANQHWAAEFGANQGNNYFQQQLSTQQQLAAEQQAQLAQGNWQQQFGHTQNMDMIGADQSQQQISNTNAYQQGQNQNDAFANAATAAYQQGLITNQSQLNDFQNQYWQGQNAANIHASDQQLAGTLGAANIYGGAQIHQANQQLAGTLGAANIYGGAQMYGSDQQLKGTQYEWDMQRRINEAMMANNLQVANTQAYGRSQAPNTNWARAWG